MAQALFKMKFAGCSTGKSKATGKDFCSIKFLEEVEEFGSRTINLCRMFTDAAPVGIKDYQLYDDVEVIADVSSSGRPPRFVSMSPAG